MKRKKLRSKPLSKEVLSLMEKVKHQLEEIKKPRKKRVVVRDMRRQRMPTVEEYRKLDPYWLSTMTGKFTGRVVKKSFRTNFPKMFCIIERIKEDLKKWRFAWR